MVEFDENGNPINVWPRILAVLAIIVVSIIVWSLFG